MAGAGVNAENVVELIKRTGVREVHLSGKKMQRSAMEFTRTVLTMGKSDTDEYAIAVTDEQHICTVRNLLDEI